MPPKKATTTAAKKPVAKTGATAKTGAAKGGATKTAAAAAAQPAKQEKKPEPLPEKTLPVKDVITAITTDEEKVIKDRWPLVIDPSEEQVVSRFVKYRNVNLLNIEDLKQDTQPDTIRLALLGAIKYGKPLIIDMEGSPGMLNYFCHSCDQIVPNLSEMLLDQSILKEENFKQLVKPEDDVNHPNDEYSKYWQYNRLGDFRFSIIMKSDADVTDDMKSKLQIIRVQQ